MDMVGSGRGRGRLGPAERYRLEGGSRYVGRGALHASMHGEGPSGRPLYRGLKRPFEPPPALRHVRMDPSHVRVDPDIAMISPPRAAKMTRGPDIRPPPPPTDPGPAHTLPRRHSSAFSPTQPHSRPSLDGPTSPSARFPGPPFRSGRGHDGPPFARPFVHRAPPRTPPFARDFRYTYEQRVPQLQQQQPSFNPRSDGGGVMGRAAVWGRTEGGVARADGRVRQQQQQQQPPPVVAVGVQRLGAQVPQRQQQVASKPMSLVPAWCGRDPQRTAPPMPAASPAAEAPKLHVQAPAIQLPQKNQPQQQPPPPPAVTLSVLKSAGRTSAPLVPPQASSTMTAARTEPDKRQQQPQPPAQLPPQPILQQQQSQQQQQQQQSQQQQQQQYGPRMTMAMQNGDTWPEARPPVMTRAYAAVLSQLSRMEYGDEKTVYGVCMIEILKATPLKKIPRSLLGTCLKAVLGDKYSNGKARSVLGILDRNELVVCEPEENGRDLAGMVRLADPAAFGHKGLTDYEAHALSMIAQAGNRGLELRALFQGLADKFGPPNNVLMTLPETLGEGVLRTFTVPQQGEHTTGKVLEALQMHSTHPCVVLTDLDGHERVRRLRDGEERPEVPVAMDVDVNGSSGRWKRRGPRGKEEEEGERDAGKHAQDGDDDDVEDEANLAVRGGPNVPVRRGGFRRERALRLAASPPPATPQAVMAELRGVLGDRGAYAIVIVEILKAVPYRALPRLLLGQLVEAAAQGAYKARSLGSALGYLERRPIIACDSTKMQMAGGLVHIVDPNLFGSTVSEYEQHVLELLKPSPDRGVPISDIQRSLALMFGAQGSVYLKLSELVGPAFKRVLVVPNLHEFTVEKAIPALLEHPVCRCEVVKDATTGEDVLRLAVPLETVLPFIPIDDQDDDDEDEEDEDAIAAEGALLMDGCMGGGGRGVMTQPQYDLLSRLQGLDAERMPYAVAMVEVLKGVPRKRLPRAMAGQMVANILKSRYRARNLRMAVQHLERFDIVAIDLEDPAGVGGMAKLTAPELVGERQELTVYEAHILRQLSSLPSKVVHKGRAGLPLDALKHSLAQRFGSRNSTRLLLKPNTPGLAVGTPDVNQCVVVPRLSDYTIDTTIPALTSHPRFRCEIAMSEDGREVLRLSAEATSPMRLAELRAVLGSQGGDWFATQWVQDTCTLTEEQWRRITAGDAKVVTNLENTTGTFIVLEPQPHQHAHMLLQAKKKRQEKEAKQKLLEQGLLPSTATPTDNTVEADAEDQLRSLVYKVTVRGFPAEVNIAVRELVPDGPQKVKHEKLEEGPGSASITPVPLPTFNTNTTTTIATPTSTSLSSSSAAAAAEAAAAGSKGTTDKLSSTPLPAALAAAHQSHMSSAKPRSGGGGGGGGDDRLGRMSGDDVCAEEEVKAAALAEERDQEVEEQQQQQQGEDEGSSDGSDDWMQLCRGVGVSIDRGRSKVTVDEETGVRRVGAVYHDATWTQHERAMIDPLARPGAEAEVCMVVDGDSMDLFNSRSSVDLDRAKAIMTTVAHGRSVRQVQAFGAVSSMEQRNVATVKWQLVAQELNTRCFPTYQVTAHGEASVDDAIHAAILELVLSRQLDTSITQDDERRTSYAVAPLPRGRRAASSALPKHPILVFVTGRAGSPKNGVTSLTRVLEHALRAGWDVEVWTTGADSNGNTLVDMQTSFLRLGRLSSARNGLSTTPRRCGGAVAADGDARRGAFQLFCLLDSVFGETQSK